MDPVSAIQNLLAELRRRRMFRAVALYVGAAFVILQLGDVVIEPLGLPAWTMALLIVVVGVGFVLTVVLAWIFDITPGGIERTAGGSGVTTSSERVRSGPTARGRAVIAAGVVILLLGGGWFARSSLAPTPAVADSGAVAVLPFKVSGAGTDLAYMREGVVDLLSNMLTERGGVATVSPRLVLREIGDASDAAIEPRTREIVRRLGGGRLITGEVIGRAEQLTITATLHDLHAGTALSGSVSGPERDLERLVDRLAAQLVAREAGAWTTGGSLNDVPLAALREYLEGLALQRHGRWSDSLDRLRRALEIDTTFAAAALAFDISAGWAAVAGDEWRRVRDLAWRHRERLGAFDRLQLEGILGPNHPEISAPAIRLRIVEQGLTSMPDRPELWYLYGDILFHEGQAIGVDDWVRRAIAAFERAREIQPDHLESDYHLMQLALFAGDTALFRSVAHSLVQRDTATEWRGVILGLTALHENTAAAWETYRTRLLGDESHVLTDVILQAFAMGRGVDELLEIAVELERRAVTPAEASAALGAQLQLLGNSGRPSEAVRATERMLRSQGSRWQTEQLQLAAWIGLAWDGDTTAGHAAVAQLRMLVEDEVQRSGAAPPAPFLVCTVAVLDLLQGRSDWAVAALPWLEDRAEEYNAPLDRVQARSCPVIMRAGIAHVRGPPDAARRRLAELESSLTQSPFGAKRMRAAGNLLAIALHEAAGDLPAALGAAQRLQDWESPGLLSTAMREEGRLLERLGRNAEAAAVYRRYLDLRASAEPDVRARDDVIRTRLMALERESR